MRNLGLDIVRFFAVSLVLLRHADLSSIHSPLLELIQQGGWVGVDLFFVLSGFLISSLLFKEFKHSGEINLTRFLIRRGFKIYPSFWLLILFYAVYLSWVKRTPTLSQMTHEILFVANYLPGFLGFTWSLAVEEHFYLFLALLFALLRKLKKSQMFESIPFVFACLAVVCLLLRIYYIGSAHIFSIFPLSYYSHLRIDSLFFGVFVSYFYHFRNLQNNLRKTPSSVLLISGICLLVPTFILSPYTHRWILTWGFVLFYIGSGAIVLGALSLETSKNKILRFIGELGMASYSIYLWHLPVRDAGLGVLRKLSLPPGSILVFPIYLFGSFLLGWLMNRLVERPMLQVREKISKNRPKSLARTNPNHAISASHLREGC